MDLYEHTSLWKNAFDEKKDGLDKPRSILKTAYQDFRCRVAYLLQQIQKELPSLTLHDITHVDSLWCVASEICGPNFDLNPSEAFVLGGAFLLHDAAHCRAAFSGGSAELQQTTEWQDSAAQRGIAVKYLTEGSEAFQSVLFDTLRSLHPKQAKKLAFAQWPSESDNSVKLFLLQNDELREAYGHVIGEIAESHWWHPHELEIFKNRIPSAPPYLAPANWTVDVLKVAVLLRTADAAHIDKSRAPRFLMVMNQPKGISKDHWQFQARLNQPKSIPDRNELVFSGSPYPEKELPAWWLAYDSACLANKELAAADMLLRDNREYRLACRSVAGTYSPEAFSFYVPTDNWQPVDTNIKISDIKTLVARFGGEKLYGKNPSAALRELLQNAIDAVHACRKMGGLGPDEGDVEIALEGTSGGYWLHIIDTGIGMSRYVLTEVLIDFGRSLWRSSDLRGEWQGLSSSGFEATGQFGIGFFSIFMLGDKVRVVSRRYEPKEGENSQWLLDFPDGTNKRPTLREPIGNERLKRHGTQISVLISGEKLKEFCEIETIWGSTSVSFIQACSRLVPASDLTIYVNDNFEKRVVAVQANDWFELSPIDLLRRIAPGFLDRTPADKFGPWTHFSDVYDDESGSVVGRCAIQPSIFMGPSLGIGVVNGLLAGPIDGVAGIIVSRPQSDLARKEAIPAISPLSLQNWAEKQKELLLYHNKLDLHSGLLAHFGASHNSLIIGNFGGNIVSFEEFQKVLQEFNEILVHDGDITYHSATDEVLEKDFENNFDIVDNILVLPHPIRSRWREKISDRNVAFKTWSISSMLTTAIRSVWGREKWDKGIFTVGYVDGLEISRQCRLAIRAE